jgi:hypothetical protein
MLRQALTALISLFFLSTLCGQTITMLDSGQRVSLRGLSAVSDKIIWVSGSSGVVGLSTNGGHQWKWLHVPHFEKSDFRDIEAFSDREAVIMGITKPAVILRTVDGGQSWSTVLEEPDSTVFLDAMCFSGDQGALIGDPDSGKIYFARTVDRGKTWNRSPFPGLETTAAGEAFFASSGSNAVLLATHHPGIEPTILLVSGGSKSSLYFSDKRYPLSLNQGKETTGANSIAINPLDPFQLFVVGGDYKNDTLRLGNSLLIHLNPFSLKPPVTPPHGYRSCVEYIDQTRLICCGTSGVDISLDGGIHWKLISNRSFHICRRSLSGHSVFLAGVNGSIAQLQF